MIIILKSSFWKQKFLGMTIYPFIFITQKELKNDPMLLNHEKIHVQQQKELLWLPFFIWYIAEFLIRLLLYRNKNRAYRNICFEREAYAHENDFQYLNRRENWTFLNFL